MPDRHERDAPDLRLLAQTVFEVAGEAWSWEAVVMAASVRGEWSGFAGEVRRATECERRALLEGEAFADGELARAGAAFRQERGLDSGEDAKRWLDAWGLSVEEWSRALGRELWRDHYAHEIAPTPQRHPSDGALADACLADVWWPDAVCSKRLEEWAETFAGRAALVARSSDSPPSKAAEVDALLVASDAKDGLGAAFEWDSEAEERLRRLAVLELVWRQRCRELVTPERVRRCVEARRPEWTRFVFESLELTERSMANEARMRVCEDGDSLSSVAREARCPLGRHASFLEELDPHTRPLFLKARRGELLGPTETPGGFVLHWIEERSPAEPDDPRVLERAERLIVADEQQAAVRDLVRWCGSFQAADQE